MFRFTLSSGLFKGVGLSSGWILKRDVYALIAYALFDDHFFNMDKAEIKLSTVLTTSHHICFVVESSLFVGKAEEVVKETVIRYFMCVPIFRDKHYPNGSVSDTLRICCFNITISSKRYVFYQNGSMHVISFK